MAVKFILQIKKNQPMLFISAFLMTIMNDPSASANPVTNQGMLSRVSLLVSERLLTFWWLLTEMLLPWYVE